MYVSNSFYICYSLTRLMGRKLAGRLRLTDVKLNLLGKRTCLSLPKESQLTRESNLIVGTGSKEDKEYHRDVINENEVTDRVNAIDNDSSKSQESFLEDFRAFTKSFLAEVNVFKKQLLT